MILNQEIMMNKPGPFKQDRIKYYSVVLGTPDPGFIKKLKLCLMNYGLHSVAIFRFGKTATSLFNKNRLFGIIPLMLFFILNQFVKTIHHVDIDRRADIGPGLFIIHYYSIVIGPVKIGSNVTVHHNLTIGQKIAGLDRSTPEIGDNVWIGPHCVITGDIKIGSDATISAGTILSRNVPGNCLASGNPGRVILHNYDNSIMAVRKH